MPLRPSHEALARARDFVRRTPPFWFLYGLYWRNRCWREGRKNYSQADILDFGDYPASTLERPSSQLCTVEQMLSPIYKRWCSQMHSPPRFARKQWEFVYILEVLSQAGMLAPGRRGLGFGCGTEPLVGMLSAAGCEVLATDLDLGSAQAQGWASTGQHAAGADALYTRAAEYVSRSDFDARVDFRVVDMNAVPDDLQDNFDFTWSACAFEHLGSLRHGMDFVRASVRCLKLGGIAVHTTEFNLSSEERTLESPGCSVYRRSDIERLIAELEAEGYEVAPLNLDTGDHGIDRYVDLPPYRTSPHARAMLEGIVVTSIGLIVRRPERALPADG
jgi:hypothetical protein